MSTLSGDKELSNKFNKMIDKSPAAAAYALTGTAYDIRKATQEKLPMWLHLTRNFLPQSVQYEKATPDNLTATVGFAKRANFTKLLEFGGVRTPTGRAIAVPVDVKTKQTGGISNANRPANILQKKNIFTATIDGVGGIWQASKRIPLRLLYIYKPQTKYNKRLLHFYELANKVAKETLPKKFEAAMLKILTR